MNLRPHHVFWTTALRICGTFLLPLAEKTWWSLVSVSASGVPVSFMANVWISSSAQGARFLKPAPWVCLWMPVVCSLVTTSWMAERPFSRHPSSWAHYAGPRLERKSGGYCGRGKAGLQVQLLGRLEANIFLFYLLILH